MTVGGSGKTPMVMALAKWYAGKGRKVGVITKGYLGEKTKEPCLVAKNADAKAVGDEACLLAQHLDCPIVACQNRVLALTTMAENHDVNVIISDDGLSNLALGRDLELVMEHGTYALGNGSLLPAGPLRESLGKFHARRWLVKSHTETNHPGKETCHPGPQSGIHSYDVTRFPSGLINLQTGVQRALDFLKHKTVHAVAAIAHPESFFELLEKLGAEVIRHPFPDHYAFNEQDFVFKEKHPVIMTEKDSVKCAHFKNINMLSLSLSCDMSASLTDALQSLSM